MRQGSYSPGHMAISALNRGYFSDLTGEGSSGGRRLGQPTWLG